MASPVSSLSSEASNDLYMELLKGCLTRSLFPERYRSVRRPATAWKRYLYDICYWPVDKFLDIYGLELVLKASIDPLNRAGGLDWPEDAETMIGLRRLANIQECVESVLHEEVPGDFIETGVWRGGAGILMRSLLRLHHDSDRVVWMADSFHGLPKPNDKMYPADTGDTHWRLSSRLAVSEDIVRANFHRYGLLDGQVRFLAGWFKDTLPTAPIDKLALLRLDGDMYESTIDALKALYPKLSPGGYCIIDDYALGGCRKAVHDYRDSKGISEPITDIDGIGVFWRRS